MTGIFDRLTASPAPPGHAEPDAEGGDEKANVIAESDNSLTPRVIKDAVQELLKYGLLEASRKPNLYRTVLTNREVLDQILEPLDLAVRVDDIRGLAFVVVCELGSEGVGENDEWSHPLLRRQRLTLEQSLLVAILRQQFIAYEQEAGLGAGEATLSLEELLSSLQIYLGGLGSDAQEQKRLRNLLEQLKGHGLVSEIDSHDQVSIRPIITHLANPESLQGLLHAFRAARQSGQQQEPAVGEGGNE